MIAYCNDIQEYIQFFNLLVYKDCEFKLEYFNYFK